MYIVGRAAKVITLALRMNDNAFWRFSATGVGADRIQRRLRLLPGQSGSRSTGERSGEKVGAGPPDRLEYSIFPFFVSM